MQAKPVPLNCESEGCCAPFLGGAGSPSNTMWPGLRLTPGVYWGVYAGIKINTTRMWANAQLDGRPAEYRWQQVSDLHSKFTLRPNHVCKYGRHPICDG